MSQRLFNVSKVGLQLDSYSPGVEKRSGEDVSVITISLRMQPFDAKLATALDDGVGGDSNIRTTIFRQSGNAEPRQNFTRHDFKLPLDRQNLILFAAPDTNTSRMSFLQARIHSCYVRTQKDMNALAFAFKATFGPVGRDELEYIHASHRKQFFVTFEESEPILNVEHDDDELSDDDERARAPIDGRTPPAPMWTDDGSEPAADEQGEPSDRANRPLHSHQSKKKGAALKPAAKKKTAGKKR